MKTCGAGHAAIAHHGDECPVCDERDQRLRLGALVTERTDEIQGALVALPRAVGDEVADLAYREAFEG